MSAAAIDVAQSPANLDAERDSSVDDDEIQMVIASVQLGRTVWGRELLWLYNR